MFITIIIIIIGISIPYSYSFLINKSYWVALKKNYNFVTSENRNNNLFHLSFYIKACTSQICFPE